MYHIEKHKPDGLSISLFFINKWIKPINNNQICLDELPYSNRTKIWLKTFLFQIIFPHNQPLYS